MTRIARPVILLALALVAALALAGTAAAGSKPHRHGKGAHHRGGHVLPKAWKQRHLKPKGDPDGDGLSNWGEFRSHTRPKRADSDRDGVSDAGEDYDRDGLDNGSEEDAGTDPGVKDTDRDGISDADEDADRDGLSNAAEDRTGNDPRDRDTDGDGVRDGSENAGVISSFDGSTLSIALATGGTLTATVDAGTAVACDDEAGYEDAADTDGADNADAGDDPAAGDVPAAGDPAAGDDVPVDDGGGEPASASRAGGCSAVLARGAIVHEAQVEGGVFVAVELVAAAG